MSPRAGLRPSRGTLVAVLIGILGGLGLLLLARSDPRFGATAGDAKTRVSIEINGVSSRMARDLLLPDHGWVLQVALPGAAPQDPLDGLEVSLREERTGMSVRIDDRMHRGEGFVALTIPKSLALSDGLLAVQVRWTDAEARRSEAWRRLRIRSWLGGPPIGSRQQIALDFELDRDGDGRPDFFTDLERIGLSSADRPELAAIVVDRVVDIALARIERAYSARDDPNRTGRAQDPVRVRFVRGGQPGGFVTRICVGGSDPANPDTLGHVRFDLRNEHKASDECGGDPARGIFPGALARYSDSKLYRSAFDPFSPTAGGTPLGAHAVDARALASLAAFATPEEAQEAAREAASDPDLSERREQIALAVRVFGEVLGTLIAREAGHALGLVAPGKPAVGLFGSGEAEDFAQNLYPLDDPAPRPWLMDPLRNLRFEELAGRTEAGELRFRPLNYAYLRDRVVLIDGRK